jgi:hypothetical protein
MPIVDVSGVDNGAKNLALFLQEILDRVITSYGSYDMPLPARRYWTFGAPAVDCEQLVVSMIQMYVGSPGDEANEPRRCNDPRSATLNIAVARIAPISQPNGAPPSADEIQNASEVSAYDAWILMESVNQLDVWGEVGAFGLGVIATVDAEAPEGGFATTRMTITLAIP